MNGWDYLSAHPVGAFFLVIAIGWAMSMTIRAARCCKEDDDGSL
jgi:hypothetical protein